MSEITVHRAGGIRIVKIGEATITGSYAEVKDQLERGLVALRQDEDGVTEGPWPEGHPRYTTVLAYANGYPRPMIDARYMRQANGTATEQELIEIRRDVATERLIALKRAGDA